MANHQSIENVLKKVKDGSLSIADAKNLLAPYEDLGFAKLDHRRVERTGFPEVIYGEGKSSDQLIAIFTKLMAKTPMVLATRVCPDKANAVKSEIPKAEYNKMSRTLIWTADSGEQKVKKGYAAVVCAGTSDLPVAEEAAVTAEAFGCQVVRIQDVGVAGIQRLFNHIDRIRDASVVISVAGMEGALTSVLAGLVDSPIVAVPTSVGYGANFQGLSALLSMLNACAPGVSVVNIDNGFGAGYYAALLHRMKYEEHH